MATRHRFINPERMGAWVVVTLGVALLSLVMSFKVNRDLKLGVVVLETQIVQLEKRVQGLEKAAKTATLATPAAEPTAAEEPPK